MRDPGADTTGDTTPTDLATTVQDLQQRIQHLRSSLRHEVGLQEGAYSVDGHHFAFEIGLARPLPVGGYVVLTTGDGRRYLGQVTGQRIERRPGPQVSVDLGAALQSTSLGTASVTVDVAAARGDGRLLATIDDDGFGRVGRHDTFDHASIERASPDTVDAFVRWSLGGATGLPTGSVLFGGDAPVPLLSAKGFNRHTFLCGQSGSGKTYGLGVVLERLLRDTTLRVVILDPNSDYVGLDTLLPREESGAQEDEYDAVVSRWADLAGRVLVVGGPGSAHPAKVVLGRLSLPTQATVLGLDPLRDAPDYAALRSLIDGMATPDYTMADLYAAAVARLDEPARRIAMRIRNLGIADWSIWAHGGDTPVLDALPDDWRVLVADVGQLGSPLERSVLASAALEWLWSRRHERQPRLVVIDEAHNVCPQLPTDASQAMATDTVIRIAAEGRKYGLYLLLSTQQPQKIHANVLAQCDNLMLLRMNSSIDIDHLAQVFSFVPEPLLRQAATFRLGQGLVAGRFSSHPVLYQGARRWTREGGADIPTTWARPAG